MNFFSTRYFLENYRQLNAGHKGCGCYMDDILVTGKTDEQHLKTLEEVHGRLKKAGMRANMAKCSFMAKSVTYLGYKVDCDGIEICYLFRI